MFSEYISPQNFFTRFIYSVLMSKIFVCHVLKHKQTRAKLLYADVRKSNLSTLTLYVIIGMADLIKISFQE